MRLAGRDERVLDADVDLGRHGSPVAVRPEPAAAAGPQVLGLLDLGQAEPVGVEPPGSVLAAGRAGDLDVVQPHAAPTRATAKIRRNGSTTP